MTEFLALLDGYKVTGAGLSVTNPATGDRLMTVADMPIADMEEKIQKAQTAFKSWSKLTAAERGKILRRWHGLIVDNTDALAALITAECGKPLAEARGEVGYGATFIDWFIEEARRHYGDIIPTHAAGKRILVTKQAIGVISAITPWNFPLAMITRKVAPALAAGCTALVKPAEATPLTALALEKLALQAGVPDGVFQVVTTTDPVAVGKVLTTHPIIKKFSFTGSTAVGKLLMAQCASTIKKLSLELGGNAPFIVFDDADLDAAIEGALVSKYRNTGQTCVCANRFLVQSGVYDQFAEKLAARVSAFQVGNGADAGTTIGPLIDEKAKEKVAALVEGAVAEGATVYTGGKGHALGGNFYEPTILTHVTPTMSIANAEIFGPVAPLFKFETEEEALQMANDTPYGLAAYFYTRDLGRSFRVMEGLDYGMVGVNEGIISTEVAPFGGIKESGIGREGSRYGLDEFTEIKYCLVGGLG